MESDFYRLSFTTVDGTGQETLSEFDNESQEPLLECYENFKKFESNKNWKLSFVSWEMELDGYEGS